MGGSAYLIYGKFEERALGQRPLPRSFLDRLLNRTRTTGPQRVAMGSSTMIDLPSADLQPMAGAFAEFARNEIRQPWPATQAVLDYLAMGVCTVYARGTETQAAASEWYVQITFSGCAGMAEVSAEICAHWAALWYQRQQQEIIGRWLAPYGFEPAPVQPPLPVRLFVPLDATYAAFGDEVEVDNALLENAQQPEQRMDDLRSRLAPLAAGGRCRCQLCAPDLDPAGFPPL